MRLGSEGRDVFRISSQFEGDFRWAVRFMKPWPIKTDGQLERRWLLKEITALFLAENGEFSIDFSFVVRN